MNILQFYSHTVFVSKIETASRLTDREHSHDDIGNPTRDLLSNWHADELEMSTINV